jgi:hypothetical protein
MDGGISYIIITARKGWGNFSFFLFLLLLCYYFSFCNVDEIKLFI